MPRRRKHFHYLCASVKLDALSMRVVSLSCLLVLSACGGAAAPSPSEPQQGAGDRIGELERELAQSEQELSAYMPELRPSPEAPRAVEEAPAQAPSPAPPSAGAAADSAAEAERAAPMSQQEPASCDNVCRALNSMRRAAAGICNLAEASSDRCRSARERVANAEARVGRSDCRCS